LSETKPHHYIIVTLTALGFLSLMRWQAITKDSMLIAGRPNQNTFAAETRLQNRDSILVAIKAGAIKNGLPESYLNEIFSYGGIAVHDKILDRFSKPYEKKSWTDYRKLFITESRIQKGVAFYTQYKNDLNSVSNHMRKKAGQTTENYSSRNRGFKKEWPFILNIKMTSILFLTKLMWTHF